MKFVIYLFVLFVFVDCEQPYFPKQIVFTPDQNRTLIAIDEVNQRAYLKLIVDSTDYDVAYVMQHMPYARTDLPQSKHYVQLIQNYIKTRTSCSYLTYWQYSWGGYGLFPLHWGNDSSYNIKNYLNFNYPMIHSTKVDEDYWYSNETCRTSSGQSYRCQEVYFKKNTDIPVRYTEVVQDDEEIVRRIENYTIYSTEKPSDTFFNTIPKTWNDDCRDGDLGISYNPTEITLSLGESAKVQVWLPAPPHKIEGHNTVTIYWVPFICSQCFKWTPEKLHFNYTNFNEPQILTITRVERSAPTVIIPFCSGGGYDDVPCYIMDFPIS